MPELHELLIRLAAVSEQKSLEDLQLRASLTNAGDRDALLAHADAIELPVAQIAARRVSVAEWFDGSSAESLPVFRISSNTTFASRV